MVWQGCVFKHVPHGLSLTDGGLSQTGKVACTSSIHHHLHLSFYLNPHRTPEVSPSFYSAACLLIPRLSRLLSLCSWSFFLHLEQTLPWEPWSLSLQHSRNGKLVPPPHAAVRRIHTFLRNVFSVCGKPGYHPKRTGRHQRLWVCNRLASLCQ